MHREKIEINFRGLSELKVPINAGLERLMLCRKSQERRTAKVSSIHSLEEIGINKLANVYVGVGSYVHSPSNLNAKRCRV